MIVLALDTTLAACSAAVLASGRVLAVRSEPMERGHQERLAPLVAEVMHEAATGFDALDLVGVTVGPGSFTGLRVGLAFAKGLSVALGIPCVGIGTLEALASSAGAPGVTAALIDARRGQVYFQGFRGGRALSDPAVLGLEAAASQLRSFGERSPLTLVGSGASLLASVTPGARLDPRTVPDPVCIGRLAATARQPAPPLPLYLRAPDARTIAQRASDSCG